MNPQILDDIVEAIENMKKWRPIYEAVLKHTGDKKQALDAVLYLKQIEEQYDLQVPTTTH